MKKTLLLALFPIIFLSRSPGAESHGDSTYKGVQNFSAATVAGLTWAEIGATPTTLSGYGITDAQKLTLVSLSGNSSQASLVIAGGQLAKIVGTGNNVLTITTTFSIAAGGRLDIGNNHVILQHATGVTEATLQAMVLDGRIICQKSRTKTIGILDNADFGYEGPGGFTWPIPTTPPAINSDDILVGFVLWGDATFDGIINSDDFNQLVGGYFSHSVKWVDGNWRYMTGGIVPFDVQTFNLAYAGSIDPTQHDNWLTAGPATLTWGSIAAGASAEQTLSSAIGSNPGDAVALGLPATVPSGIIFTGRVTMSGIAVTAWNVSSGSVTPGALVIGAKTSVP